MLIRTNVINESFLENPLSLTVGVTFSEMELGDNVNTWVSARRLNSFADLDNPGAFSHMSERARRNMFEEYNDRVVTSRVEIVRLIPELSY